MKKKLLTIALSAILVVAMAVPTFAAEASNSATPGTLMWANLQNNGTRHGSETEFLNINRFEQGFLYGEKNLTTYDSRSGNDQLWYLPSYGSGHVISKVTGPNGEQYAVNVYYGTSPYNCTVYPLAGNFDDAYVRITGGQVIAEYHNFRRMTVAGNNGNVYWLDGENVNSYWSISRVV